MIRGILYWVLGILLTAFLAIFFFLTVPFIKRESKVPYYFVRLWAKLLINILCMVKVEIKGCENLSFYNNYIIISNHRSYTDVLVALAAVPIQFIWLAKQSLFKIPVIGQAMRVCGYVPVEREKYISAVESLEKVKAILQQGKSVWIFPEGTRTPKEVLGRFKRGAFILAKQTDVPLLPVTLVGTDKIFYRPLVVKGRKVLVIIGKPFYYRDFLSEGERDTDAIELLMEKARKIIQTTYNNHVIKS